MKMYLLGLFTLPAIYVALVLAGILYRATRDTIKHFKIPLKDGYGWWTWLWLAPVTWGQMVKEQVWSCWHGIETEVDVQSNSLPE